MDWRSAFIAQARSDFQIAELLSETEGVPRCHLLHYLQMSFEKLSRGMLMLPGDMTPPRKTHQGPRELILIMRATGPLTVNFHRALKMGNAQRTAYLKGMLPPVLALERLAPALAIGPNAEYPWLPPALHRHVPSVIAPAHHRFDEISEPMIIKIMDLLRKLLQSCH